MAKCNECGRRYDMFDYHSCFSEYENIKRMTKVYEERQSSKDGKANYDINQIVTVDKDVLHHILRDEMMNSLLTVLGVNDFNKWYRETIGGVAPFQWVKPKGKKGMTRRYKSQRYHILEEDIDGIDKFMKQLTKDKIGE